MLVPGLAVKPGLKGRSAIVFAQASPPGAWDSVSTLGGVAVNAPVEYGIAVEVAVLVQSGGVLSTGIACLACGPKVSVAELNPTCGSSANSPVIWPVVGFALIFPSSRTWTPYRLDSALKKTRYSLPESGSRLFCSAR